MFGFRGKANALPRIFYTTHIQLVKRYFSGEATLSFVAVCLSHQPAQLPLSYSLYLMVQRCLLLFQNFLTKERAKWGLCSIKLEKKGMREHIKQSWRVIEKREKTCEAG